MMKNKFLDIIISEVQLVRGPRPIPVLASPASPGLVLPSIHSYGYGYQSSPASSHNCPTPLSEMLGEICGLARYGLSRIGQNVKLDAVKIRIGQTVNVEIFMAS